MVMLTGHPITHMLCMKTITTPTKKVVKAEIQRIDVFLNTWKKDARRRGCIKNNKDTKDKTDPQMIANK